MATVSMSMRMLQMRDKLFDAIRADPRLVFSRLAGPPPALVKKESKKGGIGRKGKGAFSSKSKRDASSDYREYARPQRLPTGRSSAGGSPSAVADQVRPLAHPPRPPQQLAI